MSYEPNNEASDLRRSHELIEELQDTIYEQGVDIGEENVGGSSYDSQGKIRYVSPSWSLILNNNYRSDQSWNVLRF